MPFKSCLSQIKRILQGHFDTRAQLLVYCAVMLLGFTAFMVAAWVTFDLNVWKRDHSRKNFYAPWNNTFSELGSRDDNKNPKYYLLFSCCLWWLIVFDIPLSFFVYRRNVVINKVAAVTSQVFYVIGWIGIILDGCFCSTMQKIPGTNVVSMDIHVPASTLGMIGFAVALFNNAFNMVRDQTKCLPKRRWADHQQRKLFKPKHVFISAIVFLVIAVVALICKIASMILEAQKTPEKHWWKYVIGGCIWENILICALIITIIWNALGLPVIIPTLPSEQREQIQLETKEVENIETVLVHLETPVNEEQILSLVVSSTNEI
ncbi:Conserved_hypothetical protein [Hexamita inflata]|uniref:Uncharacterized protein n=1 Tax=Hexamita inflata TaxID=28002 RepID=A0AA86Q9N2_9EUKA|nr:Conserved hypothetical protein [Hexamita inflata]